ncbi:hypothetical protein GCM10028798_18360 [Humibacter antri]
MSVVLCVTLWPRPGQEAALVAYEDSVLALLPEHGARVVTRVRAGGIAGAGGAESTAGEATLDDGHPFETQIIELPSDAALNAYLRDPRRAEASDVRDRAIARTEIQRVTLA